MTKTRELRIERAEALSSERSIHLERRVSISVVNLLKLGTIQEN